MGNVVSSTRKLRTPSSSTSIKSLSTTLAHSPLFEKTISKEVRPIEKLLIANRGEIACRIIKTARSLGVKTVAVYSDVDRNSLHVRRADEAVCIGPASAQLSYLSTSAILDAARRTGADAIHPGYGFLSENAKFAESCKESGLTFIGPPTSAISLMGDKSASKKLMKAAGVPVVPGYHGEDQSPELLQSEANRIGYPVLIKPVLGGGGKGMRIVHREEEFMDSLTSALRESQASFGDSRVLIEKYIARPRHVEVQVFGDKFGNVVHLFERDCSVQRRHQKIIEEAPAPLMTEEFRKMIGRSAVDAAKAVEYESAGTVEFILDTKTGLYYFMEMNTRLQVEHPVTEMVTRQDLVEWQIRVAKGEPIPLQQDDISLKGHAFEARIYAENVPKGFLPASGVLHHYSPPEVSSTVRVETGVEESDTVSVHYDPMIAKLVVWGHDRQMALTKLHTCLSTFQVAGLPSNIDFLKKLAKHPSFKTGKVETHFIENFKEDLLPSSSPDESRSPDDVNLFAALAAVGVCIKERRQIQRPGGATRTLWHTPFGFRLNHAFKRAVSLEWEPESGAATTNMTLEVIYSKDNEFSVKTPGPSSRDIKLKTKAVDDVARTAVIETEDGVSSTVNYGYYVQKACYHVHVWKGDAHFHFSMPLHQAPDIILSDNDQRQAQRSNTVAPGAVVAPMAGLVIKVLVESGKAVKVGESLLVLEAMKMEHTVKAHVSGVVSQVNATVGQQVNDGEVLYHIQS